MFCAYPAAHPFSMYPLMPTVSPLSTEIKTNPLPWKPHAQIPTLLKTEATATEPKLQFKMPGPMEQLRMMHQLQQLQMIQYAMQQSLASNGTVAAKGGQVWLSEEERVKQARDFVMLKRILFDLSDDDHCIDIEAAEAALRERDPEIFTRTKRTTFQQVVIQANKVGVHVSWLDATRSPSGKECLRLTQAAIHYISLVKVLMKLCTDEEPMGELSCTVAAQLKLVDPGFWSRRPTYKGPPLQVGDKVKRGNFKQRVLEAQRMGAPVKWTGAACNYSYVGLEW